MIIWREPKMSTAEKDARLNFRLPAQLKQTIEHAAALAGQTVSDFAVATLLHGARTVLEEHERTELSNRDRDRFVAALNDVGAKPNRALSAAARRYKRQRE